MEILKSCSVHLRQHRVQLCCGALVRSRTLKTDCRIFSFSDLGTYRGLGVANVSVPSKNTRLVKKKCLTINWSDQESGLRRSQAYRNAKSEAKY